MKPHPLRSFSALLAAALLTPACKPPPEPEPDPEGVTAPEPDPPALIAACFQNLNKPLSQGIREAMAKEAAELGYEFLSLDGKLDADRQRTQIRSFIEKKASAIAIHPRDPAIIGAVTREANMAGIPVFTILGKRPEAGAEVASHIGANEFQGGQLAGEALLESIGESGGEILVLDDRPDEAGRKTVRGLKNVVGRFNASRPSSEAKLHIAAELTGDGTRDTGFRAVDAALPAHPHLVGLFATGEASALGAVSALEKAGKQDRIAVISFGADRDGKQAIRDGRIYAASVLRPEAIGRLTVRSIADFLAGKEVPPDQSIDFDLFRKVDTEKAAGLK